MGWIERLLKGGAHRALPIVGVLLIGAQTLAFGGGAPTLAMVFSALFAVWAAAVVAASPPPAAVLYRPSVIIAAGAALMLACWVVVTLTGVIPAWVNPAWAQVGTSGAITVNRAATVRELVELGGLACVFVGAAAIGWKRQAVRFALRALAIATAAYAIWAVASFKLSPFAVLGVHKTYHYDRLTASFASANTAASLFGGLAVLFAVLAVEEAVNQLKKTPEFGERGATGPSFSLVLWAFTALVCLGALLLTGSRFGMAATALGLAAGVGMISVVAGLRARLAAMIGLGALALAAALPILIASAAARRAWNLGDTIADRINSIQVLAGVAAQRPWQGFGLGAFRDALAPAMTRENLYLVWDLGAAHNLIVQWWIETGLVGTLLAGVTLAALMVMLSPFPLKRSRPGRGRLIGVIAFSIVVLTHNMVDYSLQISSVATVWALLLGLAAGASFQGDHQSELA